MLAAVLASARRLSPAAPAAARALGNEHALRCCFSTRWRSDGRGGGPKSSDKRPKAEVPAVKSEQAKAADSGDGMVRLAKLMAQRGLCSRREAEAYIQGGAVLVNGEPVQGDWLKVPEDSVVELAAPAQRHQRRKVTVVLNKPLGVVSAQPEDNHKPAVTLLTFANEFQDPLRRKQRSPMAKEEPVNLSKMAVCGRLDVNSTGLLVFTQDGTLAKRLLDPKGGVEKEYLVRVDMTLDPPTPELERKLRQLRTGVTTEGVTYRAKSVEVLNANQLRVILTEGKNRHVRRMCDHVGLRVMALKRVRIGELKLGKLPVGQWRYLQPTDRI